MLSWFINYWTIHKILDDSLFPLSELYCSVVGPMRIWIQLFISMRICIRTDPQEIRLLY
jgi:hypothetical protein